MSILVDNNTRLLVQGLGKAGTFHAVQCRDYGTNVVGGVTPGKGGTDARKASRCSTPSPRRSPRPAPTPR